MAKIVRTLLNKVRSIFRGRKPTTPKVPPSHFFPGDSFGHRGVAAGNLQHPDVTPENLARRQMLTQGDAEDFLNGQPLFVHSSNVAMVQYHAADNKMMVEYKDGSAWLYSPVTLEEAKSFLRRQSKGAWVWDNLRVRGTKHGHKKNAVRIR